MATKAEQQDAMRALSREGLKLLDADSRSSVRFNIAESINEHGGIHVLLSCRDLGSVWAFIAGMEYVQNKDKA